MLKNPPVNAEDTGDVGLIPQLRRSPGEGNDNPLQYSCLGNTMDRGAWWAIVHGRRELDTTEHILTHRYNKNSNYTKTIEPSRGKIQMGNLYFQIFFLFFFLNFIFCSFALGLNCGRWDFHCGAWAL